MESSFYIQIANSTAHRPIRDLLSGQVLKNKTLLSELLAIGFNVKDKNHHKACWIAELVFEAKIEWLKEHLDTFCEALPHFTNESAMRPISKIGLLATEYRERHSKFMNTHQVQQITEACFDWLINPKTKVATKAYAMRTLFLIGKKEDWIHHELQRILSEDASKHTAAYTAAAKDVLRRITKFEFMQGL
ncbi:hypothetical protein R1T16_07560 [Flavobacterium sp. DG1-102-2]|uniref:hypothetical protein n=1 Tax=Flavobacterium sp. DG1-102-2 TaxID=3081663 RepID=UPI002948D993|nr:hypothetical protein [Flavobacterium sp. DG1-102-2]MDV6168278.1 hypothetical protein [Flavobacterium sp. DG1-102-2]